MKTSRRIEQQRTRGEGGFALLLTVMVLLLLVSLGFASMNVVETDQQVAGYQNRKKLALHAAEAGVAKAMETLRTTGTPSVPTTQLGDSTLYPHGRPTFRLDTSVADPIEVIGTANLGGMNLAVGQNGSAQFQVQFWRVHVEGQAPGGTVSRLEVVTGSLLTN
jgi:Tfp pilus assembly protein PilX